MEAGQQVKAYLQSFDGTTLGYVVIPDDPEPDVILWDGRAFSWNADDDVVELVYQESTVRVADMLIVAHHKEELG